MFASMKHRRLTAVAALLAAATATVDASAQEGGFALNKFEPAPAGDVFFGVPAPFVDGHLDVRAYAMFDFANQPIRIEAQDAAVVASQGFLRLDVSLAVWDRILASVDAPLAVVLDGDDPGIAGTTFSTLDSPQMGDVRVGLRGRLYGENRGPFQLGLGSYLFLPSGSQEHYTGEGAVRGQLQALLGGRAGNGVGFVYNIAAGTELRGSDSPHTITFGGGVGLLLLDEVLQFGVELYGATPVGAEPYLLASLPTATQADAATNMEVLASAKLRLLDGLTFGAAAGPGLVSSIGTPNFRAVGMLGWTPLYTANAPGEEPDKPGAGDSDDDGIADDIDACPNVKGQPSADPEQDGCPPPDRDGDEILDVEDACPGTAGVRSTDVTLNGCPVDSDGDGVHDGIDACLKISGEATDDPATTGCPIDSDGDGIVDSADACPKQAGAENTDVARHGCSADPDGDGIEFAADACPDRKGPATTDPRKNGCPQFVTVTEDEILIAKKVNFNSDGRRLNDVVSPNSSRLLGEVRDAIMDPDIELVEVQGHTDDSGSVEYNLGLSRKRANAVLTWLLQHGVPKDKIVAKGYGFDRPIADNRIWTGRAKNRRVQFVILRRKGK